MEEKQGHFKKRIWVDEISEPEPADFEDNKNQEKSESRDDEPQNDDIDKLIADTASSVKNAVDNVINLGNALLGTKEGRSEIKKKAKTAGKKFIKSLEDALEDAKKNL